mmetsp:Transcript_5828/g.16347  ORF Transcript_5828/g.16347 Transcript_5828/m.16347 type:complete len:475 (-) Transcript_5828:2124-3548(-)
MTLPSSNHDDEEVAPKMEDVDADDSPERATNFDQLRKMKSSIRLHGPVPGDDEFDENNAPVRFVVNEWAQGTSIHGVPYVTDSIQWRLWKRATWIVLVLVSAAFMIWQISELIAQYRNFDIITDTATVNKATLEFPEVTVCNANMYSKSLKNATGIIDPKNEEELIQISTPLEQEIFTTWFNGIELNTSEYWRPAIVSDMGLCWVFHTNQTVRRPGFYGGLKFWMTLQQDDYEEFAPWAGALVWTLQPGSEPTVLKASNGAKPGKETFFPMDYTDVQRERTAPWARCKGEAPQYTQSKCRNTCYDDWVRENCGCRNLQDTSDTSLRFCERFNEDDTNCFNEILDLQDEILGNCGCDLPPCTEQLYETTLTELDASETLIASWSKEFNITEDYIRKNFISVTVNFKSMQYDKLTESKGMTFAQLLGAIGGSMGFFLGISLVSIFELLGDLIGMRLIPRLFGHKKLYGVGAHYKLS